MDIVVQLILISGVLKYACKATFFKAYRGIIIYSLLGGMIALAAYPFIVKTDTDVFTRLLSNRTVVSYIAVILTIEAIGGMLISIAMLSYLFEKKRRKWIQVLKLMPGELIAGLFLYAELSLCRFMVG
jgi:hypothetical protein